LSVGELLPPAIVLGPPPVNAHGNARVTWAFAGLMTWGLAACAFIPDWRREVRGPIAKPLVAAGTLAGAFLGVIVVALQRGYAGQPALAAMLAPMSPVVVLTVALALFAWFLARRQALDESDLADAAKFRRARLIYAIVAIGGLLLALGPRAVVGGISLGAGLYQPSYFPPFGVLRAPERFGLWFAFGLAVLAGLGTARLVSLLPRAPAVLAAVVLLVLLNVDLRPAPIDLGTEDPPGPGHYRLATLPEPGSVFELPGERWKLALLGAFEHGRPVVNGVGYVSPPGYTEMRGLRQLGQERLDILWEHFHPRLIMVRGRFYDAAARARVFEAVDKRKDAITIIEEAGEDIILRLKDRGRGPALPRRWPRASLEKAEGLQFSAIVTGGREDRIDRLTLSLNDHLVLELEGRAAADPENRRVPIRPEWLVPYENRFNVRADYRYRPGQPAHPIGKTNVSVAADVQLRADGRLAWYQVNGDRREVAPGYTLVALDAATGAVRSRMSFDTGRGAAASARLAQFVATLPDATPVLVVSEGQTSSRLTDDAVAALRGLGLRQDPRTRRAVHAAIGVKGAAVGSVPEQVHRSRTEISLGTPEHREVQLDGFDLY
jgi:hypothetical protein